MQVLVSRVVLPGGAVYSVFIWLVIPVIVSATALKLLQCVHFGLSWAILSLGLLTAFFLVPGGVPYFLVMMSSGVVALVGGFSRCSVW